MTTLDLIKKCRTYRRFEQKVISDEAINEILEAARYTASGRNAQPLEFIVAKSKEAVEKIFPLTKWAGALPPELGTPKDGERPVLYIAVIINTEINKNADTDAGLAIQSMSLAAMDKGIGRCILGAIDRPKLSEMFALPETKKIHTLVAFGYPSHESTIEDFKGETAYHLDDKMNYIVPKRKLEDIVRTI